MLFLRHLHSDLSQIFLVSHVINSNARVANTDLQNFIDYKQTIAFY